MTVAIVGRGWAACGVVSYILDCTGRCALRCVAAIVSYRGIPLQGRGLQLRHTSGVDVVCVLSQCDDAAAGFLHGDVINTVEDVLGHVGGVDVMKIVIVVSSVSSNAVCLFVDTMLAAYFFHRCLSTFAFVQNLYDLSSVNLLCFILFSFLRMDIFHWSQFTASRQMDHISFRWLRGLLVNGLVF